VRFQSRLAAGGDRADSECRPSVHRPPIISRRAGWRRVAVVLFAVDRLSLRSALVLLLGGDRSPSRRSQAKGEIGDALFEPLDDSFVVDV
jgi:hypothetical protein